MYCGFFSDLGYKYLCVTFSKYNTVFIAYKTETFEYVEHSEIDHSDLAKIFPGAKDEYPRNDFRHKNGALIVTLKHNKT